MGVQQATEQKKVEHKAKGKSNTCLIKRAKETKSTKSECRENKDVALNKDTKWRRND